MVESNFVLATRSFYHVPSNLVSDRRPRVSFVFLWTTNRSSSLSSSLSFRGCRFSLCRFATQEAIFVLDRFAAKLQWWILLRAFRATSVLNCAILSDQWDRFQEDLRYVQRDSSVFEVVANRAARIVPLVELRSKSVVNIPRRHVAADCAFSWWLDPAWPRPFSTRYVY